MKRHTGDQSPERVAFNFEDVQLRCEEYKAQVKEECRQLALKTQQQSDDIRARAEAEGASEGYRNGLARAELEITERSRQLAEGLVEERLSTVVPSIAQMIDDFAAARSRCRVEWETDLVGTAVAIAEKIVRKSMQLQPDVAAGIVEHAVELACGSTTMQIRLNPVDLESLGDRIRGLVEDSSRGIEVQFVPDASVSPGGCMIATEQGQIDGRLETMLERIASELLEGLE